MILNCIEWYNFEFYKVKIIDILRIFISGLFFVNKRLTISMFPFLTAKLNAVVWKKIKTLLNNMIFNVISIYIYEFHWNI